MNVFTIGFTKSTAKRFFERIKNVNPSIVIDIRRSNTSQLAGFAKGEDLSYFLHSICNCIYTHDTTFAPSEKLLSDYKGKAIDWSKYEVEFDRQMELANISDYFKQNYGDYKSVCLLCSESTPEKCHRRLVAEKISRGNENIIIHL